jgi:hypothetical protein
MTMTNPLPAVVTHELDIHCTVERLGPEYEDTFVHFTVSLAVSLNATGGVLDLAIADMFVKPWRWAWNGIAVYAVGGGAPAPEMNAEPVVWVPTNVTAPGGPIEVTDPAVGPLVSAIDADYLRLRTSADAESLLSRPAGSNHGAVVTSGRPGERPLVPWRVTLASLWRTPQPVPQILNLTRYFRIDRARVAALVAAGRTGLVAAPTFTGAPFAAVGTPYQPTSVTAIGDLYRFAYPVGPAPTVSAIANEGGLATPADPADPFIRVSTLISTDPAADKLNFTGDFAAHLPSVLAETHDMPEILIQWLDFARSAADVDPLLFNAAFRRALIAALHDAAHTGARPTAAGESPAVLLARLCGKLSTAGPAPASLLTALEGYENGLTAARWEEALASILAERLSIRVEEGHSIVDAVFPPLPEAPGGMPKAYRIVLDGFSRALHAAYDGLRSLETLALVVETQWSEAIGASADSGVKAWWALVQSTGAFAKAAGEVDLRKLLALSSSSPASRAFSAVTAAGASLDDRVRIVALVETVLQSYVRGRFASPANDPYENYKPAAARPGALDVVRFAEFLTSRAKAFVRDQIVAVFAPGDVTPEDEVNNPLARRTETVAENLAFLVGGTRPNAEQGTAGDVADPLRRVSGAGVLLGRQGHPWRCLNFGLPMSREEPLRLGGAVHSVVALGYRNGLRQSILEYRNDPFLGTSPIADVYDNVAFIPEDEREANAEPIHPYIRYRVAYGKGKKYGDDAMSEDVFLEQLVYGDEYRAVVYLASTCGALPRSLAATVRLPDGQGGEKNVTVPWRMRSQLGNVGATAFEPDAERQGPRLKFLRRVPVGLAATEETGGAIPSVPKDVYPIARTLRAVGDEPLLLLVPRAEGALGGAQPAPGWRGREFVKYETVLLPPSVDVKVWQRWAARDGNHPEWDFAFRRNVLASYLEEVDVDPRADGAVSPSRTRIDDPAIESLVVVAERVWPRPAVGPSPLFSLNFPRPTAASGLGRVRSAGIKIRITALGPTEVAGQTAQYRAPAGSDPFHTILVPVGEVWRFSFRPKAFAGARARFKHGSLTPSDTPEKALAIVAEVAAPLPSPATDLAGLLHGALDVTTDPNNRTELRVALNANGQNQDLLRRIHRVEAYAQRWRWDGRPLVFGPGAVELPGLDGFPFDVWRDHGVDALEDFDGVLFGDRSSEDALITPSQVEFVPQDGVSDVTRQPLYAQRIGADAGALYYRFGARAYSRYEGLMTARAAVDSRDRSSEDAAERWIRHVVPCRHIGEVPRPRVKLVVPLYVAAPDDPSPGLLVVLDEPVYADALAGLAERIEAAVDTVVPPGGVEPLAQMGPDPILFGEGNAVWAASLAERPMLGPMGFTFDTDSSAPLLAKAAYFWRPPMVDGAPVDLANHFVRLRFRRAIEPKGFDDMTRRPDALASEWTQGVWARVLPSADRFAAENQTTLELLSVSVRQLVYVRATKAFEARDRKGERLDLLPTAADPGSRLSFTLFAVLTREIPDALGRKDATAATAFLPLSKVATSAALASATGVTLVEIMHHAGFEPSSDNIVEALFPSDEIVDVPSPPTASWEAGTPSAEIVRVSPTIPIV